MKICLDYLPPKTKSLLEKFAASRYVKKFYLAGGTAIALYLNHRRSDDLDFFSVEKFRTPQLISSLKRLGRFEGFESAEDTLLGVLDGIKVSFFTLPYGLLEETDQYKNLRVAGLIDLALMKILAISDRGTKRDFVDLYLLCQIVKPMDELMILFQKKFGKYDYNLHHIIKSLAYFKDAESDEMPRMYTDIQWKTVKAFFENEKYKLANKFLS